MKIEAVKGRFCYENKQFLRAPFSSLYTSPEPDAHLEGEKGSSVHQSGETQTTELQLSVPVNPPRKILI